MSKNGQNGSRMEKSRARPDKNLSGAQSTRHKNLKFLNKTFAIYALSDYHLSIPRLRKKHLMLKEIGVLT